MLRSADFKGLPPRYRHRVRDRPPCRRLRPAGFRCLDGIHRPSSQHAALRDAVRRDATSGLLARRFLRRATDPRAPGDLHGWPLLYDLHWTNYWVALVRAPRHGTGRSVAGVGLPPPQHENPGGCRGYGRRTRPFRDGCTRAPLLSMIADVWRAPGPAPSDEINPASSRPSSCASSSMSDYRYTS